LLPGGGDASSRSENETADQVGLLSRGDERGERASEWPTRSAGSFTAIADKLEEPALDLDEAVRLYEERLRLYAEWREATRRRRSEDHAARGRKPVSRWRKDIP